MRCWLLNKLVETEHCISSISATNKLTEFDRQKFSALRESARILAGDASFTSLHRDPLPLIRELPAGTDHHADHATEQKCQHSEHEDHAPGKAGADPTHAGITDYVGRFLASFAGHERRPIAQQQGTKNGKKPEHWSIFIYLPSQRKGSSQDIQNRKQKDPNDIHEVPVQARALQESVTLRRSELPAQRFDQAGDQQQDTDKDVEPVETC